jgi:carboxylesterase type B
MESTLTSVAKDEEIVGPVVHTALGDLRGFLRDGIAAFYGVPYAAPPVGDLRFAQQRLSAHGVDYAMQPSTVRSRHSCPRG